MRKYFMLTVAFIMLATGVLFFAACDDNSKASSSLISSRSYSGHESDADANNFVRAYPSTVGKRLDDCQTCHTGKTVTMTGGKTADYSNPCSYCHLRVFDAAANYTANYPTTLADTLNAYGKAYKDNGKNINALNAINGLDSDGDGYSNGDEIGAMRFPGDAASNPGQAMAPTIELGWDEITGLTQHTQFMLLNANKQQYDEYTTYRGARMIDIMNYLTTRYGVDFTGATNMVFYAPDGYKVEMNIASRITNTYAKGKFYDLSDEQAAWKGTDNTPNRCFVSYPVNIYSLVQDSVMPHDLHAMIAYQKETITGTFVNLDMSYYNATDGKISGEGPYRIVRPQVTRDGLSAPDGPDRSTNSTYNAWTDGWQYNSAYDHNAGDAVKGTCIIKILPMPTGVEEYYTANGWSLIDDKKIIVYGHGVPTPAK